MKNTSLVCFSLFVLWCNCPAQSALRDSLRDNPDIREYRVSPLFVEGEVENPGVVRTDTLPLRSVPVKELGIDESGKLQFKGAFFYTGYSLYDILKTVKVKKANEKEFHPSTDLYLIVENESKQKVVLSWGEVFYARNHFQTLISKSVEAIYPSKAKTRWPLPPEPRLICADDLYNVRFITNPTTIIVHSFSGSFAAEKPDDIYAPEITIIRGSQRFTVSDVNSSVNRRSSTSVSYGHGMGYKGLQTVDGYVLVDVLKGILGISPDDSRTSIAVVSAKDGYRCVFSVSEIFNRNNNEDFLLIDEKDSKKNGRYSLFASPDFYVDRNVKAIEKIEIVRTDSLP